MNEQGKFFEWFLIRRPHDPTHVVAADPSVKLVDHQGTWWLYRRQ
jgi:hypothetical protein